MTCAAQAQLDFAPQPAAAREATTFEAIGFEIGWDHAHYRLTPPVQHLLADNPVRQGWQAGMAAFGRRTLQPRAAVQQWLELRLEAWVRGRAFEAVQLTPNFLAQLDVEHCPVTREAVAPLPERINADAGYAAGNLALLSARACAAKAEHGWRAAAGFAHRLEAEGDGRIDGLDAAEWSRLAVLMSFATPLPHREAACMPLLVLPPNRLRVLNPVQALQTILTLQFTTTPTGRRIADLAALLPDADLRQTFQIFMHTLLAQRVAAGRPGSVQEQRRVMEDAWRHPLVNRRWQRLALRLTEADCQRIVEIATRRGLAVAAARVLEPAAATEGWALETAGCLDAAQRPMPAARSAAAPRRSRTVAGATARPLAAAALS